MTSFYPLPFLELAASQIADPKYGLTGSTLIYMFDSYAKRFGKDIPIKVYPFDEFASSKKKAFLINLGAFDENEKYSIIYEMSEPDLFESYHREEIIKLRINLTENYKDFAISVRKKSYQVYIEPVVNALQGFPDALKIFQNAAEKFYEDEHDRNCLDDLRLSLETLVKSILKNSKSLENQITLIGGFVKDKNGSVELRNMLSTLIKYFTDYQNSHVKHQDKINDDEIEFIFELSSTFLKHLAKLSAR